MDIRPATPDDATAIQTVARDAWYAAYESILGRDRIDELIASWYTPDRLRRDDINPSERPLFVAESTDAIVGFTEAVPDETDDSLAHLYRIYVTPAHWGNGYGTALLERLQSTLRSRGFTELELSVMAENDTAVRFYESRGFERIGERYNDQLGIREYVYWTEL